MSISLRLVGDPEADRLLSASPFALLVGMLLDQQIPMEVAFAGPRKLAERLGTVDPAMISAMDPEEFVSVCATPPAVHRFPASMGRRVHDLATAIMRDYQGNTAAIWAGADIDGALVLKRLKALPGFGDQKARIFLALLGKQYGVDVPGWREAAGAYGDEDARRSIADIVDDATMNEVRAWKKEQKAAARAAKQQQ
ncbi:HhH-GPD-type base excision DNA repair protein [soil metagenome]